MAQPGALSSTLSGFRLVNQFAQRLQQENVEFSEMAKQELRLICGAVDEILDIRKRYDNGETISSIEKDYLHKISHSTVRRIALRESYASVN